VVDPEKEHVMNKQKISLVLVALVILAVLTACAPQQGDTAADEPVDLEVQGPSAVIAEGTLLPVRAEYLAFQAAGFVQELDVALGDAVVEGQVLARLSSAAQIEAQIAAAELEVLAAQQDLDTLIRTGDANLAAAWTALMDAQIARAAAERAWERLNLDNIADRIEDAEADLIDLQADLDDAQEEFDKYTDLDEDNRSRTRAEDDLERAQEEYNEDVRDLEELQRERDMVRADLDAALAAEAEAQHQFDLSSEGPNADTFALAQSRLSAALAQLEAAQGLLDNYVLEAPFDGVVTDLNVDPGEQVFPGTWAVSIADTTEWVVESTDVTELEIVRISVGQGVTLTPDAFPEVSMGGVVTEIGQSPVMQSGDVTYVVRVSVEDPDTRVMWGMTVELVFDPVD
jgi:multidrug efflux pump subunit AcrA (membrane-fusion protein)